MKSIFLADAHLQNPEDPAYQDLLRFFENLPDDLDNLFILGDFFDFWHGYKDVVFSHYVQIVAALKKISEKGVKIHFFAGNHEASFGPILEAIGTCHGQAGITEIEGQKIYLAHGDRLNPDDYLYRLWHSILCSRFLLKAMDIAPAYITLKVANILSHGSQGYDDRKKFIPPQVFKRCATILNGKDDIQSIIIGHFHQERQETFITDSGPKSLYIIGDWIHERSYLLLENGKFSFHQAST
jgi:UDP-2,3-diacylglucosamine hydrolase